ncbi:MAG: hypothetical protein ACM3IK_03915 [Sphingomonadaceae bacterium]
MNENRRPEQNPLVERVDALLRRHQNGSGAAPARADDDVPVLTEVVDPEARAAGAQQVDQKLVEVFANELETAVLLRLAPELDRLFEERLAGRLGEILEQVLNEMRAELSANVHQMVREAIAASVAQALGTGK